VRVDGFKRRAYATCALLAVSWTTLHYRSDIAALFQSPVIAQEQDNDHEYDGSILFSPDPGNRCHQRLVDNARWQIRDNGIVDCSAAMAQIAESQRKQAAKQHQILIRNSFLNR
jgi:hypothetical protein